MKTSIAILAAAAVLGLNAQKALADGGWATTGKILTGLVIGGAVARAIEPPPTVVYAAPPVVYTSAPTYTYAPAPVVTTAPVVASAPVAAPAPVYVQPAPAPVYVQAAPVVVYAAPVYRPYPYYYGPGYYGRGYCYAPPLVSFRFGFGGGHWHHR